MVQTELKFVRLMEELDALREEISDLGAEYNSIEDRDAGYETHDENGDILPESFEHLENIENLVEDLECKISDIAVELDVQEVALETYFDSCITNRWEIYAQLMGADIVSLVDLANGRA